MNNNDILLGDVISQSTMPMYSVAEIEADDWKNCHILNSVNQAYSTQFSQKEECILGRPLFDSVEASMTFIPEYSKDYFLQRQENVAKFLKNKIIEYAEETVRFDFQNGTSIDYAHVYDAFINLCRYQSVLFGLMFLYKVDDHGLGDTRHNPLPPNLSPVKNPRLYPELDLIPFPLIAEKSNVPIFIFDKDKNFCFCNGKYRSMFKERGIKERSGSLFQIVDHLLAFTPKDQQKKLEIELETRLNRLLNCTITSIHLQINLDFDILCDDRLKSPCPAGIHIDKIFFKDDYCYIGYVVIGKSLSFDNKLEHSDNSSNEKTRTQKRKREIDLKDIDTNLWAGKKEEKNLKLLGIDVLREIKSKLHNNVLMIVGEEGSGKEFIANYIHQQKQGKSPFIPIYFEKKGCVSDQIYNQIPREFKNQRNMDINLLEKGIQDGKPVLLDLVTLCFQCLNNLSVAKKKELYSICHERKIRPSSTHDTVIIPEDTILIICSEHSFDNLVEEVKSKPKAKREIQKIPSIMIPPLRKHIKDIFPLANSFLEFFNILQGINRKSSKELSELCKQLFKSYEWKWNCRELYTVLYQANLESKKSVITIDDLKKTIFKIPSKKIVLKNKIEHPTLYELRNENYTVKELCDATGMPEKTIYRWCMKYEISIRSVRNG